MQKFKPVRQTDEPFMIVIKTKLAGEVEFVGWLSPEK